ncbi:MAG: hypothetical protein ACK4G4_12175 [Thermus sp.]|uniref:hypothetical protein n=1 Tax=Thermus sp. TaxID=275 RepID=UPI00391B79C4
MPGVKGWDGETTVKEEPEMAVTGCPPWPVATRERRVAVEPGSTARTPFPPSSASRPPAALTARSWAWARRLSLAAWFYRITADTS